MSFWIESLKYWNSRREGKYMIPKKGTAEYNEVKAIMDQMKKRGKIREPKKRAS